MQRKKHVKTEYERCLRQYRKNSSRHVLVLEADMPEDMKRKAFGLSDQLRICGNQLASQLSKALGQLFRTKRYRGLQKAYGAFSERLKADPDDEDAAARLKETAARMAEMQKGYHATWDDTRRYMEYLKEGAGLPSIFALARCEDVWSGAEKVLYGGADAIHFKKRGCLPEIRAKQPNRGIVISAENGRLWFSCPCIGKEKFSY
ncbi:MAG: hypothetical protein NC489_20950, partial [Ruminococcus flavefaciens]|nr:hypothetical protein [Ruminococcus flavefaciens]